MLEEARTIERVLAFKSGVLRLYGITDYAEDNREVVRGLRALKLDCRIWHFKRGCMILDYEVL